jgi:hypothetical protein
MFAFPREKGELSRQYQTGKVIVIVFKRQLLFWMGSEMKNPALRRRARVPSRRLYTLSSFSFGNLAPIIHPTPDKICD